MGSKRNVDRDPDPRNRMRTDLRECCMVPSRNMAFPCIQEHQTTSQMLASSISTDYHDDASRCRLPPDGQESSPQSHTFHHQQTARVRSVLQTTYIIPSKPFSSAGGEEQQHLAASTEQYPVLVQPGHVSLDSDATTFMDIPLCDRGVALTHQSNFMRRTMAKRLRRLAKHLRSSTTVSSKIHTLAVLLPPECYFDLLLLKLII